MSIQLVKRLLYKPPNNLKDLQLRCAAICDARIDVHIGNGTFEKTICVKYDSLSNIYYLGLNTARVQGGMLEMISPRVDNSGYFKDRILLWAVMANESEINVSLCQSADCVKWLKAYGRTDRYVFTLYEFNRQNYLKDRLSVPQVLVDLRVEFPTVRPYAFPQASGSWTNI